MICTGLESEPKAPLLTGFRRDQLRSVVVDLLLTDRKPVRKLIEHIHEAEDVPHTLMRAFICDDLKALVLLLSLKINQESKRQ